MKYVLFLLVRELGTVGRNSGVRGDQYFHQKNSISFPALIFFLVFLSLFFESILVDVLLSLANMCMIIIRY